ncbi:ABC-2 transporter permease [Bacillus sp. XF8]|uniref:ABC-2 transporter permease n=1 Tax=Bacillus sp. XF8 TaxID=2819289 RepID=UPI001AA088E8|nr:ABC-2 transporter permease [Bacillus sp. XF8]MBO1579085.1 ABC-2 transporter permease [Bacillus sp. XF8]
MLQLVYKDVFFFRVTWLVNIIMPIMMFALEPNGETVFPISCLLITLSSAMVLIAMDERNKSEIVLNSLPVRRRDIIIARYISCVIFIAVGMIATMVAVWLIRGIASIDNIGVYHPNLYIEIPWYVVLRGVVFSFVFIATLFPSYYGTKSKVMQGILTGGSMTLAVIIGIFIDERQNRTAASFIDWIMNPSHIGVFIVGVIILASIYIISMFITIKIYETRDL